MIQCPACLTPEPESASEYLRHCGREYHRCDYCGTIHVPGAAPDGDVYDDRYFEKFRGFSGGQDSKSLNVSRLEFLRPFMVFATPKASVLDFGCGSGDWLNELWADLARPVNMTPTGVPCVVVGVDINPEARRFVKAHFPHVAIFSKLEEAREWFPEQFGMVTAFDVIEHFSDPNGIMESLAAATVPAGLCMLSTPYLPHDGFTAEQFKDWRHCRPLEHFCHFTIKGLEEFMRRHGFSLFTFGHPEDGIRKPGANALGTHNILTIIARKEGYK